MDYVACLMLKMEAAAKNLAAFKGRVLCHVNDSSIVDLVSRTCKAVPSAGAAIRGVLAVPGERVSFVKAPFYDAAVAQILVPRDPYSFALSSLSMQRASPLNPR